MIKVISWIRRKPDLSPAEFHTYWRNEHPKVVLALPGLRRYVQNHTHASGYAKGEPPLDGVAETWWDSRDAVVALGGTRELEAVLADEHEFLDVAAKGQFLAEEHVVLNQAIPHPSIKQLTFIKRRPDLGVAEAHDYWRTVHGPLALPLPGLARYVQNHTLAAGYRPGRPEPAFDGVTMVWFGEFDALRATVGTPELAAIRDDGPAFMDTARSVSIVADEHHII